MGYREVGLDICLIICLITDMKTNVTTLLREFPKVRRAALAGETVIIETREGNLRLTADRPEHGAALGRLKGRMRVRGDIVGPTSSAGEWQASL